MGIAVPYRLIVSHVALMHCLSIIIAFSPKKIYQVGTEAAPAQFVTVRPALAPAVAPALASIGNHSSRGAPPSIALLP